jgi:hypothetical protein
MKIQKFILTNRVIAVKDAAVSFYNFSGLSYDLALSL